jgi:hypothetical protein
MLQGIPAEATVCNWIEQKKVAWGDNDCIPLSMAGLLRIPTPDRVQQVPLPDVWQPAI